MQWINFKKNHNFFSGSSWGLKLLHNVAMMHDYIVLKFQAWTRTGKKVMNFWKRYIIGNKILVKDAHFLQYLNLFLKLLFLEIWFKFKKRYHFKKISIIYSEFMLLFYLHYYTLIVITYERSAQVWKLHF